MIQINFYLKDCTEITTFNELKSNPFKIGDKVSLSVIDIRKYKLVSYINNNDDKGLKLIEDSQKNLKDKFNLVDVVIESEEKYVKFNFLSEPILVIDYYCYEK